MLRFDIVNWREKGCWALSTAAAETMFFQSHLLILIAIRLPSLNDVALINLDDYRENFCVGIRCCCSSMCDSSNARDDDELFFFLMLNSWQSHMCERGGLQGDKLSSFASFFFILQSIFRLILSMLHVSLSLVYSFEVERKLLLCFVLLFPVVFFFFGWWVCFFVLSRSWHALVRQTKLV